MILLPEDYAQLTRINNLYGHVFDGQWDLIDQVFTTDATLDASSVGLGVMTGLSDISEKVAKAHKDLITSHMASNSVVLEFTEEGVVKMICKYQVAVEGRKGRLLNFGIYHDTCTLTPQGWRISHRRLERVLLFGGHEW